jgi:hypothetical protein
MYEIDFLIEIPHLIQKPRSQLGFVTYLLNYVRIRNRYLYIVLQFRGAYGDQHWNVTHCTLVVGRKVTQIRVASLFKVKEVY